MVDPSQARTMADEIEQAESMLAAAETPRPRPELLEDIKYLMIRRQRSIQQRKFIRRMVLTAAAACLLIAASLFLNKSFVSPAQQGSSIASAGARADTAVEEVSAELEEITDQLYSVRSSIWDSPEEEFGLDEIEDMQLLQEKDFWKG